MAPLGYETFEGELKPLPIKGKPLLLNLWASWCAPCAAELKEMVARESEIRGLGIEVIALAVDGLEDNSGAREAQKLARRMEFPFLSGRATRQVVSFLQDLHDRMIPGAEPLPVPTSFLIDEEGRVAVIYKGRLPIDALVADRQHSKGTLAERFVRSAPIVGSTLPIESVSRTRNEFEARYRHATYLHQIGFPQTAAIENRALTQQFPKNAGAHNNLGISYISAGEKDQAEASFREALRIQPDHARANANLGTLLASRGNRDEAARHLEQAIRSDPRDEKTYVKLGRILLELERWTEAQALLEEAVALNPQSTDFHTYLAFALAKQGQLAEAASHLETALEIQPGFPAAQQALKKIRGLMEGGN